ncbi:MAG: AAA family ATPase [Snowella sp.]|nr:AAA family ATPase [Snowella sp.]
MMSEIINNGNGSKSVFFHHVLVPLSKLSDNPIIPYLLWKLDIDRTSKLEDKELYKQVSGLSHEELWEVLEQAVNFDYHKLSQAEALEVLGELAKVCNSNGEFAIITAKMRYLVHFEHSKWDLVCKPFADDIKNRLSKGELHLCNEDFKSKLLEIEIQTWLQESNLISKTLKQREICKIYGISNRDFQYLAFNLDKDNAKPEAKLLNSDEFMQLTSQGNEWLITGLIPNQGVTIIGAVAGCGKTTLAYDLAGSVIYGDDFLGENPLKTGDVLIVASDELPCFSQDKLINRGIVKGFHFLLDWDVSQWHKLDYSIEATRPKLVIVDSFSSIHSNDATFNENSSIASQTVKKLEQLSCKYSLPVVLIHHLAKSKDNSGVNRLRGSSAIAASCSNILILDGNETVKKLKQVKVRGSEPLDLEIEMNPNEGTFKVLSGNQDSIETKSLAKRLESFFSANRGTFYSKDNLMSEFSGDNFENLIKSLNRLVKQGKVTKKLDKKDNRVRLWGSVQ